MAEHSHQVAYLGLGVVVVELADRQRMVLVQEEEEEEVVAALRRLMALEEAVALVWIARGMQGPEARSGCRAQEVAAHQAVFWAAMVVRRLCRVREVGVERSLEQAEAVARNHELEAQVGLLLETVLEVPRDHLGRVEEQRIDRVEGHSA